ncbi:MAG: hypothetical protein CMG55_06085 [Candidatus Marinimicrobia bacterium]|nr:hypothetical protein [Candidatus Neomarinimicrobiota bacterium]
MQNIYAEKALSQIPRLLSNLDRNQFSPTYGCFHRDYWLDKTSDFPDAVRQFGVQSLALVYKKDFPNNIYKGQDKIKQWAIAGLNFWVSIQHADGSFDEFYPYERGWVGPTAFTTFTSIEAYNLLKEDIPNDIGEKILNTIRKSSYFICKGESEEDHLANHHAMACLTVWKAFELLGDKQLEDGFYKLWEGFKSYHNYNEGWSREYDGVDPGYLSATVSFLGKIYKTNPSDEIFKVLKQSVEFASNFVYPNGFYAGSLGSRNTLHFYPHGFEILSDKIPLAGSIAEKMLFALSQNKLVPPEIISDRYVFYRVPEFLQAYLDYAPRADLMPPLPYEKDNHNIFYNDSKIFTQKHDNIFCIANLAKGGVIKVFSSKKEKILMNDCGVIGRLYDGSIITTQWIDPTYKIDITELGFKVSGKFNKVPSNKLFNPLKNIIFRFVLITLGWIPTFSHYLKGKIRQALILGQRKISINFKRELKLEENKLNLVTEIEINGNQKFKELSFGDEFFVRYVPQSRYFQSQELEIAGKLISDKEIKSLNKTKYIKIESKLNL